MSTLTKNWPKFNSDILSDVKFVVRASQHGDCSDSKRRKMVIPAHKFLFSIRSPVFFAMFCGKIAETTENIDLPDCEYDGMFELLRYIYTDEVCLTGSNVMQVAYLADKYMIPCLAKVCAAYLRENLDSSNVFGLLKHAQQFVNDDLLYRCWDLIDTQTDEILKSSEFMTIERYLLGQLMARDTLTTSEVELFKAVVSWAEKECERQKLKTDGTVIRQILGEKIVKNMRFSEMKQEEFEDFVLDTKILTPEETNSIMQYFSSKLSDPLNPDLPNGFVNDKRVGSPLRCCRFESFRNGAMWEINPELYGPDKVDFTVDQDIILHGVSLFGSDGNAYSVTVKTLNTHDSSVLASKSGIFTSETKGRTSHKFYHGFDVLFDDIVFISKYFKYRVEFLIDGPHSGYGIGGFDEAYCAAVKFTFEDNQVLSDDERAGQFPEILFKLKEGTN